MACRDTTNDILPGTVLDTFSQELISSLTQELDGLQKDYTTTFRQLVLAPRTIQSAETMHELRAARADWFALITKITQTLHRYGARLEEVDPDAVYGALRAAPGNYDVASTDLYRIVHVAYKRYMDWFVLRNEDWDEEACRVKVGEDYEMRAYAIEQRERDRAGADLD